MNYENCPAASAFMLKTYLLEFLQAIRSDWSTFWLGILCAFNRLDELIFILQYQILVAQVHASGSLAHGNSF